MAWHGKETRCTLLVNLVRYHTHLVLGAQGTLVPEIMTTSWGSSPRFGAVRFDCCGHTLDIVLANLDIEDTRSGPLPPTPEARQAIKELLGDIE